MENKIKISTKAQIERLVGLMEENPQLGRGIAQFGSSRQQLVDTWLRFATILNGLGPPSRTGPEWQRVWVHYKANLKRKLAKNKSEMMATGGGPLQELSFSPNEQRVMELTHINRSINPIGQALGIIDLEDGDTTTPPAYSAASSSPAANSADTAAVISAATPAATSVDTLGATVDHAATLTPAKRAMKKATNNERARMDMLAQQLKVQKELLSVQQKNERHSYKIYALKKKKMQMLEQAMEEEKELRQVKLEIAKKQLAQLNEYTI